MLTMRWKYIYLKSWPRLLSVCHYGQSQYEVTESASCSNGIFTSTRVIHALSIRMIYLPTYNSYMTWLYCSHSTCFILWIHLYSVASALTLTVWRVSVHSINLLPARVIIIFIYLFIYLKSSSNAYIQYHWNTKAT